MNPSPTRPALRPLALPTEHGGWGFLFEPIALALVVAPTAAGALVALAFGFAFLARQPLRLALQDAVRGRTVPRTAWCRVFALAYSAAAALALSGAAALAGPSVLVPLAAAAPFGFVQIVFDARNQSRALLPELAGATAMSSSAAAIALAGRAGTAVAILLPALVIARALPTIVYVRILLARAHGQTASSWPALALHVAALLGVAAFGPRLAAAAMAVLLVRAAWQLARPVPRATRLGWTEIAFGALTVALAAAGLRIPF